MPEYINRDSSEIPPPRLRGSLLEALRKRREVGRTGELDHAPTWELEFSSEPISIGDLERHGYQGWNTNHVSDQDALAVASDRKRFAVADGMGGYGTDKLGTRFFAKYMSDYVVQNGVDVLFDRETFASICQAAEEEFKALTTRTFSRPRLSGSMIGTVGTTLTYAEVLSPTQVRLAVIGDSPAFVLDGRGACIAQYGEDAQSGGTDNPVDHKLAIDSARRPIGVDPAKPGLSGLEIVNQIVEVPPGGAIVLATDYFSDRPPTDVVDLQQRLPTAAEYQARVISRGKIDDATLLAIRPGRIIAGAT